MWICTNLQITSSSALLTRLSLLFCCIISIFYVHLSSLLVLLLWQAHMLLLDSQLHYSHLLEELSLKIVDKFTENDYLGCPLSSLYYSQRGWRIWCIWIPFSYLHSCPNKISVHNSMYSQNSCTAFANSITFYITNRLLKITSMDEVPICILCCDNSITFYILKQIPLLVVRL